MQSNTFKTKRFKFIIISLVIIIVVAGAGLAVFNLAVNLLPKMQKNDASMTKPDTAKQTYNDAKKAENERDFIKAKGLYEKALPYYKSRSEASVMDKNMAYAIETRIKDMQDMQDTYNRLKAEEMSNPAIKHDE